MAAATTSSPKVSPHPNGLLLVTIRLARSYLAETSCKNRFEVGVTPEAKPPRTPLGALLGEYRIWLVQERGLTAATVLRYENTARRFLQQQAMAGGALKPAPT
jgi:hypothetical protein